MRSYADCRKITDHIVNPVNDKIDISVCDEPGAGGASHEYIMRLPNDDAFVVRFQNGPIAEKGINGITQEALIAICIDRLRSFQAGPFACRANALALTKLEESLQWLHSRTRARMVRGVEGKTVA